MTTGTYRPYLMQDVRAAMARPRFVFGSGFTGAGGADLGYALAGGRPVFGIEIEPEAVRTFRKNLPDSSIEHRDFREIATSPILIDRLLRRGGLARGELDLFHTSPPCNEYSRLGPGLQQNGTASLIFDVVQMAKIALPRVIVVENVPDLASRYGYILRAALQSLCFDATGRRAYYANFTVLNASGYGVPQRRKRLFVVAVRADVAQAANVSSDDEVLALYPQPAAAEIPFEAAVQGLQQNDADLHPFRRAMATSNLGNVVRQLKHDPSRWMTPRKAGLGLNRFSTIRAASGLPLPTLTASGQQPDGRSGVVHPTEHRKLSLREMMRGSSWPDDYIFTGTVGQAATGIGMSVPPLQTKAIADALYERVLRPFYEQAVRR